MMQTILAGLLLFATASSPALPVSSAQEAAAQSIATGSATCPNNEPIFAARLAVAGVPFTLLMTRDRFVLVDERDGDDTPVWFGTVQHDEAASFRLDAVKPFSEVRQDSPCDWLTGQSS